MALTDTKLKSLKPADKVYKVVDRDGMHVVVALKGTLTFRYDYRLGTRRETLTGRRGRWGVARAGWAASANSVASRSRLAWLARIGLVDQHHGAPALRAVKRATGHLGVDLGRQGLVGAGRTGAEHRCATALAGHVGYDVQLAAGTLAEEGH